MAAYALTVLPTGTAAESGRTCEERVLHGSLFTQLREEVRWIPLRGLKHRSNRRQ